MVPNLSGDINLSASAGKIALVSNSDSLAGACPLGADPDIVDLVGYGTIASYSGANGVTISNGANNTMVIYAPWTSVSLTGTGILFGAVAGKTLTVGNSGALHYDTRLKTIWPNVWNLIFGA